MIRQALPTWSGGCATRAAESLYPRLWSGCASLWAPCLARPSQATWTLRQQSVRDFGYRVNSARRGSGGSAVATPYGASLNFTGSGGGFFVPNSAAAYNFFHQQAVFTLLAVVRTDNAGATGAFFDSALLSTLNAGISFYQTSAGKVRYDVMRASSGNFVVSGTSSDSLVAGAWNVAIVTCDGATGRIWLNGRRNGSDAATSTLGSGNASNDLGIGTTGGAGGSSIFNGSIALLGIWNRALTPTQVRQLSVDPLCMFRRRSAAWGRGPLFKSWFTRRRALLGGGCSCS